METFRQPSMGRHVHRELLRSVLLDLNPTIAATACHQRNYAERYSRLRHVVLAALQQCSLAQKPTGVTDVVIEADGCHVTWIISLW